VFTRDFKHGENTSHARVITRFRALWIHRMLVIVMLSHWAMSFNLEGMKLSRAWVQS